jgi:metal-responsive CopG/Arc/MetJ family transcriptional regulator
MGRPPLNMRPIPVRISEEVVQRIDAIVGTHQRAKFIREAIERELERREWEDEEGSRPS